MRTALTIITTAILTAIAFLFARQQGFLDSSHGANDCASLPNVIEKHTLGSGDATNREIADTGESCQTPWGDTVTHGESFLSFANDVANEDGICVNKTVTCNDGTWLGDIVPYEYAACALDPSTNTGAILTSQNCLVGDIIVPHDSTYTFYKEIKSGNSYEYQTQQRYCFDGQLEGDESYTKLNMIASCSPTIAVEKEEITPQPVVKRTAPVVTQPATPKYNRCTGPFGGVWEHGKSGTAYTSSSVPYGQSCSPINVVCGYGSLRYGTASNIGNPISQTLHASCNTQPPAACDSACGTIPHTQTVTTYTNGSIPHGNGQTCDDVRVVSTCTNGVLSPGAGSACSCSIQPPAACIAPNGQTVGHNNSLTLYQYPQVQALAGDGSDTCVRQWRKCINGTFHDYGGTPASFTFQYPSCTVIAPPEGGGPGGEGIPQG